MERLAAISRALSIAAVLPALAIGIIDAVLKRDNFFDLIGRSIGYALLGGICGILLGVPCALVLPRVNLVRWWSTTLSGLLFAGAISALWLWPPKIPEVVGARSQAAASAESILGQPASALWGQYAVGIAEATIWGTVAGYLFWYFWTTGLRSNKSLERTREGESVKRARRRARRSAQPLGRMSESRVFGNIDSAGLEVVMRDGRLYVRYDVGAHYTVWREDEITQAQFEKIQLGGRELTSALLEMQAQIEQRGEDAYVQNWNRGG
jgi:hypothetical protein